MKISYYLYLLLLALFVISCGDKNSYTLKGDIKGLQNPELYIVSGEDLHMDTIQAESGLFKRYPHKFTFRGSSQTIEPLVIYMENGKIWITLWVQNGETFSLTGDANYPEVMMVKGGEINQLLSDFKTENLSLIKEKCELRDKLSAQAAQATEPGSNVNNIPLSSRLKNIDQLLKTQAKSFVETHPSSIAALVTIQDYILDVENASNILPFLNLLSEDVKANPLYDKLYSLSMKDLQIKSGKPALDFKIKDIQNDTISLETFKGKYLILTFANSRCEFCKPEYAELLAIQNKFPPKELTILTISLDENKENWKNLAQEQKINWTQAIDSTGWASEIASLYNVLSVPCNYLIDKEGTIIGSKLQIDSIQTIVTEKLKMKK